MTIMATNCLPSPIAVDAMKTSRSNRSKRQARKGASIVEFAICAPVLVLIGFGFINCGLLVQMKHNSKLIGHMAASELFRNPQRNAASITAIETKYEGIGVALGIVDLEVAIAEADDLTVVTTNMSVSKNSLVPINFQTIDSVVTETHVFAPLSN